jgi:ABC-type transport system involved in multi-copper enzyme maturation permease subunit
MRWLLWKDFRVNRLVFIVALVLLVVPHSLAVLALSWTVFSGVLRHDWPMIFLLSGSWSLALLQLTLALMGGNSIAGERIDRSAEFFAYMPVSRVRAVTSKILVASTLLPLIWLPNVLIMAISAGGVPSSMQLKIGAGPWLGTVAITGLTFFCVAWLFSSMLESPTFSVCAGLIAPFLVWMGILWTVYLLGLDHAPFEVEVNEATLLLWYWGLSLAISAASFASGTFYYLRRVEP